MALFLYPRRSYSLPVCYLLLRAPVHWWTFYFKFAAALRLPMTQEPTAKARVTPPSRDAQLVGWLVPSGSFFAIQSVDLYSADSRKAVSSPYHGLPAPSLISFPSSHWAGGTRPTPLLTLRSSPAIRSRGRIVTGLYRHCANRITSDHCSAKASELSVTKRLACCQTNG